MTISQLDKDAFALYEPFITFLVRWDCYGSRTKARFMELLSEAGLDQYDEAQVGQFLIGLQAAESRREDNHQRAMKTIVQEPT